MTKTFPRPPVVAILGHVDHGKTTLLDFIRKSSITKNESGGITQKIGAYEVSTGIKGYPTEKITFIDTPGHEAFSKLRARGANIADIAVLVVDIKESVKPQTIESIYHIKSAKMKFIVALNKIDLPGTKKEKAIKDLMKHEVITEEKGGNVIVVPISAKTGQGVNDLLEAILFLSNDLKLSYSPKNPLKAYIIETKKDKRGIVASVIIKDGLLTVGDFVYCNETRIKVRAIINDQEKSLNSVLPSTPFELLGFQKLPDVGTILSSTFKEKKKEVLAPAKKMIDLQDLINEKKTKKLNIIIKADSQGSIEAITDSLTKKDNINIILVSVGNINKSDVFLAKASKAIIIGFSVGLNLQVKDLAKQENIVIKNYKIIYELLDELHEVANLIKEKEKKQKNIKGIAKILATFIIDNQTVYGTKATKGKVNLGDTGEIYRENKLIGTTKLSSLRIRAKSVNEIKKDQEAGMVFEPRLDIKIGDVVKFIL